MNRLRSIAAGLVAAASMPLAAHAADEPLQGGIELILAERPAAAGAACGDDPALTALQRRVLAKYDERPEALLQFVCITRPVLLLDSMGAAQWAERYRKTHPSC